MTHDNFVKEAGVFVPPATLAMLVSHEHAGISKEEFFNSPAHQPIKDAWQAAVFGMGYQAISNQSILVRLSSQDRFPDFQIKTNGGIFDFEAAMVVTRPLGKLYKGDTTKGPVVGKRPEHLPSLDLAPLRLTVKKKADKNYSGSVHLSVYVNTAGAGGNYDSVSAAVREVCGDAFESVWLIVRGAVSGEPDRGRYFLACAKASALLVAKKGWLEIPDLQGA